MGNSRVVAGGIRVSQVFNYCLSYSSKVKTVFIYQRFRPVPKRRSASRTSPSLNASTHVSRNIVVRRVYSTPSAGAAFRSSAARVRRLSVSIASLATRRVRSKPPSSDRILALPGLNSPHSPFVVFLFNTSSSSLSRDAANYETPFVAFVAFVALVPSVPSVPFEAELKPAAQHVA